MELTKELIEQMPAGHEMDTLIARHVFSLDVREMDWPCGYDYESGQPEASGENPTDFPEMFTERWPVYVPAGVDGESDYSRAPVAFYSTDIAAAWGIVEHLKAKGYHANVRSVGQSAWATTFVEPDTGKALLDPWPIRHEAGADTACLSICRAALLTTL